MNKKILVVAVLSAFTASAMAQVCSVKTEPVEPIDNSYYAGTENLSGDALKAKLNQIISKNHRRLPYTSSTFDVWDALSVTDEDPNNPNNVILMYTGRSQAKSAHGGGPNDWNREHTYPKSQGGFKSDKAFAYTDIHHLRPTDASMNSERGSLEFDEGGSPTKETPSAGNKKTSTTFEPRDEVKGDVARIIFYMATRYEGHDPITPDLELSPRVEDNGTALGNVCTLLEWHANDPVDSFEANRNDKIHSIQLNRNPFIDHPEWAEELFRSSCY